jgi:hypothetical protein
MWEVQKPHEPVDCHDEATPKEYDEQQCDELV